MQAKIIGGSADSEMPVVTTSPFADSPWPTVIRLHAPTNPRIADLKASGRDNLRFSVFMPHEIGQGAAVSSNSLPWAA